MRILVIEDDASIRGFVVRGLREEGFAVDESADGEDGRFKAGDPAYDLVVLDLTLPKLDGIEVLGALRREQIATPILILTARDAVCDRVRGLESGADDYLVKPFAFDELLARTRALLRRTGSRVETRVRVGSLTIDRMTHRVTWSGRSIELSAREFSILEMFMAHPDQVLSRTRIYEHVWNEQADIMSNVIDVHVKEIRRKLARVGGTDVIETLRGAGYRLSSGSPS